MRTPSVLVTGGGRGVGRAIALGAARVGARVLVADNGCEIDGSSSDPSVADAVVAEIRAAGGEAHASASDVAARGSAEALVARAVELFGALDAVVHCAGIALDRSVLKLEPEALDRVLDVHVRASFALVRAAGARMVESKAGGSIVLASGPSAFFAARGLAASGAANAAVVALCRTAALELRRHRVRVNVIVPTARTRVTESLPTFQGVADTSLSADHVASVALFLMSSAAEDISGEVVGVAGARAYAIRARESTGAFSEGPPFEGEALREIWPQIVRG